MHPIIIKIGKKEREMESTGTNNEGTVELYMYTTQDTVFCHHLHTVLSWLCINTKVSHFSDFTTYK